MKHSELKQILGYYKTAFDNSFDTITMFQENAERISEDLLAKADWMPAETKCAVIDWIRTCKQARTDFITKVDEQYQNLEKMLMSLNLM